MNRRSYFILLVFTCVLAVLTWQCTLEKTGKDSSPKLVLDSLHYIGSESCRNCHAKEYEDWLGSDHDLSMAIPDSSSVKGDFNTRITLDGIDYHLFIENGEYKVTETDGGNEQTHTILYTFGVYPLQQYLVELKQGKIQTMRLTWDTKNGKWFHQLEGQKIPDHDWLHWTNSSMNWSTMCASCHSTNVQKNFEEPNWTFNTTYDIINVSCEACHGPGSDHVALMDSQETYVAYGKIEKEQLVNKCASCHSRRVALEGNTNPHVDFQNYFIPEKLISEYYYPDGQIKDEDYVYTSFLSSRMFMKGVVCNDCHNVHSNKLKFDGNLLCTQCHEASVYDTTSHHHHNVLSDGAQCINCHMDGRTYMGNDYRRDHSFRIPRPDQTVAFGTPNACNSCHEDKSATWASNQVKNWFGDERKYHFSDDLIPASYSNEFSEKHCIDLLTNDTINPIVRATAVIYLSRVLSEKGLSYYMEALKDEHVEVRQAAFQVLGNFQELIINFPDVWHGLTDRYKSVRVTAFRTLQNYTVPNKFLSVYKRVESEYLEYLNSNSDMVSGQFELGGYYLIKKEYKKAEIHLTKAYQMDSLNIDAPLTLAKLYAQQAKVDKAENLLSQLYQNHSDIYIVCYYYGLILSENNNTEKALYVLRNIPESNQTPNSYYNIILLLNKSSQNKAAYEYYSKALKQYPNHPKILSLKSLFS